MAGCPGSLASLANDWPLEMERAAEAPIPHAPTPEGFVLDWRADPDAWVALQRRAERRAKACAETYRRDFGSDDRRIAERQCFLMAADGRTVGTATAWFGEPPRGASWGRVHWVAVDPAFQGRRLSRVLLNAVLERLSELGHQRSYLVTSLSREAAIRLYLWCGFQPCLRDEDERAVWRRRRITAGGAG